MFSVVSFKNKEKKKIFSRLFTPTKAILEQYEGNFGIINVYTLAVYKNKEKAFRKLANIVNEKLYTANSEIPKEYLKRLYCEQLIAKAQQNKNATLTLYYTPEKQTLINLTRKFKAVYITEALPQDITEEIWKECGALPTTTAFPPKTDYKATGNETPIVKSLPKPYSDICPKDFPQALFAALLYKENGIFIT